MGEVFLHGVVSPGAHHSGDAPPHERLPYRGLLALISATQDNLAELDPEALAQVALTHHAVLRSYCDTGPVLPMRFGAVFSSAEAVRRHVEPVADRLVAALKSQQDQREYSVRLIVTGDPGPGSAPVQTGRDFLNRSKAQRDLRRSLGENRIALARVIAEEVHQLASYTDPVAPRADRVLDLAASVPTTEITALGDLVHRFGPQAEALGLALRVSGPWPAYGFTLREPELSHGA